MLRLDNGFKKQGKNVLGRLVLRTHLTLAQQVPTRYTQLKKI